MKDFSIDKYWEGLKKIFFGIIVENVKIIFSSEQLPKADIEIGKKVKLLEIESFQEFKEALFKKEELPAPDSIIIPKEKDSFSEFINVLFTSDELPNPEKKEENKGKSVMTEIFEALFINDSLPASTNKQGKS